MAEMGRSCAAMTFCNVLSWRTRWERWAPCSDNLTTYYHTNHNDKQRQTTTLWHYQHNGHDKIRVTGSTRQWGGYDLHMFAWNPNFDPQFWSCAVGFGCIKSRLKHLGDTEDLWRNSAVHREEAPWMIWAWRRCCDATMLSQSWRAHKSVTIPGPFFGQTRIWSEVRNFNTRFACGFPVLSWFCAPILFTSDRFLLVRFPGVGCSKRIFFGSAGNRGPKNITHYMSHA